jgi:hypothetical protein
MTEPFEGEIEKMIADLEPRAAVGDGEALYDLSMLHHDLAVRRLSSEHFATAGDLLRKAAAAGSANASKRLSDWETLRYAFERRLARPSDA